MEELRCLCSFQVLEDICVGAATVPAGRTDRVPLWCDPGTCSQWAGDRCFQSAVVTWTDVHVACTENNVMWPVWIAVKQLVWAITADLFSPLLTFGTRWKNTRCINSLLHLEMFSYFLELGCHAESIAAFLPFTRPCKRHSEVKVLKGCRAMYKHSLFIPKACAHARTQTHMHPLIYAATIGN